mmetsp:Transcript_10338/g.12133  ORF Transcript_10338/g.12133 Transcript_10338/m.12133 type:complete len:424 (-) Transcript_10338:42-1313(-)
MRNEKTLKLLITPNQLHKVFLSSPILSRKRTKELSLLIKRLETSMTKFRTGIDKLKINRLKMLPTGMVHETLPQNKRTLLNSNSRTLKHDPVLIHLTVMGESTHGRNALLGKIRSSLARRIISLLTNAVHLLVEFGSVEITVLTGTWYSGTDTSWMPGSDTGNLTQTTMRLTGKTCDTPTGGDTLIPMTFGDSKNIQLFILGEDRVDGDFLFEKFLGEGNLLRGVFSSIDLNLHDVSLLNAKVQFLHLGVRNHTYNGTELSNTVQLLLNILPSIGILGRILGKRLPLTLVPILITPPLILLTQMLRKHSRQIPQTTGSLHIPNHTHNHHRWGFHNGDRIDNLAFVHEGTGTVNTTDYVGHTRFVSAEGGEVGWECGIGIAGEGAYAARVVFGAFFGEELEGSVAGCFKFTVRHGGRKRERRMR